MRAVYRATHLGTKRTVAIKVIHPQLSSYDQLVARSSRWPGRWSSWKSMECLAR
ncbi:MAG TPA: hypothetical protein VFY61_15930 [Pyrinomonadaceae bacterium]|nr:hypothetical protein [Pyrinomonadaceae bacterium]